MPATILCNLPTTENKIKCQGDKIVAPNASWQIDKSKTLTFPVNNNLNANFHRRIQAAKKHENFKSKHE